MNYFVFYFIQRALFSALVSFSKSSWLVQSAFPELSFNSAHATVIGSDNKIQSVSTTMEPYPFGIDNFNTSIGECYGSANVPTYIKYKAHYLTVPH